MKKNKFLLVGLLSASVLLLSGSPVPSWKSKHLKEAAATSTNLTIYWIDTEGGAATLIVTPAGESILIDTGNPGGRDSEEFLMWHAVLPV
jgi:beta-lactamase superfamily II metal-dependent hydrolase